jgi:hypothetical protein
MNYEPIEKSKSFSNLVTNLLANGYERRHGRSFYKEKPRPNNPEIVDGYTFEPHFEVDKWCCQINTGADAVGDYRPTCCVIHIHNDVDEDGLAILETQLLAAIEAASGRLPEGLTPLTPGAFSYKSRWERKIMGFFTGSSVVLSDEETEIRNWLFGMITFAREEAGDLPMESVLHQWVEKSGLPGSDETVFDVLKRLRKLQSKP